MYAQNILGNIMNSRRGFERPLFHSGRTDADFGHNDYLNACKLGSYHWHHTFPPHLHPCMYENKVFDTKIVAMETISQDPGIWIYCNFPEHMEEQTMNKKFNEVTVNHQETLVDGETGEEIEMNGRARIFYSYGNAYEDMNNRMEGYFRVVLLNDSKTDEAEVEIIRSAHLAGEKNPTSSDVLEKFYLTGSSEMDKSTTTIIGKGIVNLKGKSDGNLWFERMRVIYDGHIEKSHAYCTGLIEILVKKGSVKVVVYMLKQGVKNENGILENGVKENEEIGIYMDDLGVIRTDVESDRYLCPVNSFPPLEFFQDVNCKVTERSTTDYKVYSGRGNSYRIRCGVLINNDMFVDEGYLGRKILYDVGYETGNSRNTNLNNGKEFVTIKLADTNAPYPIVSNEEAKWSTINDGEKTNNKDERRNITDIYNYYNVGNWTAEYIITVTFENKTNTDERYDLYIVPAADTPFLLYRIKEDETYDEEGMMVLDKKRYYISAGFSSGDIKNTYYTHDFKKRKQGFPLPASMALLENINMIDGQEGDSHYDHFLWKEGRVSVPKNKAVTFQYLFIPATQGTPHTFHVWRKR